MSARAAPIARFVLASALAHAAVLIAAHAPAQAPLFASEEPALTLRFALVEPVATVRAESPRRRATRRQPTPRPAAAREHAPRASSVARSAESLPAEPEASEAQAAPPAAQEAEEGARPAPRPRAWIRTRLEADLARHFDYPYLARLRGWEGTVWLAFRLEADGRLESVRLARSSGFAALDAAALHSLERVDRLPQAVAWLQGHALDVELPVIYRLVGVR